MKTKKVINQTGKSISVKKISSLRNRTDKPCKLCGLTQIFKQGMCYSCFRNYANEKLREWHSKNKDKYRQYEQNRINNAKEKDCKQCGKKYKASRNFREFCSRDCSYTYWRENNIRTEQNNPAYRNGQYTKKSLNKNKDRTAKHLGACRRYRTAFRKNNDYDFCELCGTSNSAKFETHHIVFASETSSEELHNFKNLIYLCIKCHNDLHTHKIKRNKLIEERGLNELFGRNFIVQEKNKIN